VIDHIQVFYLDSIPSLSPVQRRRSKHLARASLLEEAVRQIPCGW